MASQNQLNNTIPDANFTVPNGQIYVGSTAPANPYDIAVEDTVNGLIGVSVQNLSAGASAGVNVQHIVEVGAADAFSLYSVNGGGTWSVGLDNSDTDSFKISTGSSPSAGTVAIKADSSGNITTANSITATTGNIAASAGAITANTSITAGTALVVTAGDLTISSGEMYQTYQAANSTGAFHQFYKSRSGGAITTGDFLAVIAANGHDGTGFVSAGALRWQSTGTIALNRVGSIFTISTHPDSTSAAATRFTIASTGATTIAAPDSGTGLTISGGGSSTTGRADFANGISFDAGTNTLSSYVGTTSFTPSLLFGGGSTGLSYTTRVGNYTRVGSMVTFQIVIQLSAKGTSTGSATISGLPVAAGANGSVFALRFSNLTYSGQVFARAGASSTSITLDASASAGAETALDDTNFANNTVIAVGGSYHV